MKKHKLDAGDTITFDLEFVITCDKDAIYDEVEFKQFIRDCAIRYLHDLCKVPYEYEFDDVPDR